MTYQALVPKVASAFGLEFIDVSPPQKGYRNESYRLTLAAGEEVNLIFHKNEKNALKRIDSADQAAFILNEYDFGLPARTRFDKRTLKLSDGKNVVYAGLYTYLPGKTIPWEAYTMNHIKLLGWAMSDMHSTWRRWESTVHFHIADELRAQLERMKQYFSSPGVKGAMEKKLGVTVTASFATYVSLLGWLDRATGADDQTLHMDLVRGNVLFGKNAESPWRIGSTVLSGVIDFEKAALGHPVYDIARTLAFLLVDCSGKDRRSIFKYFLQSGYNKRGASSFKKSDTIGGLPAYKVLTMLISLFLLYDFYKLLKHTPYESLEQNHHFVRTRDILAELGMIRLSKD